MKTWITDRVLTSKCKRVDGRVTRMTMRMRRTMTTRRRKRMMTGRLRLRASWKGTSEM